MRYGQERNESDGSLLLTRPAQPPLVLMCGLVRANAYRLYRFDGLVSRFTLMGDAVPLELRC